MRTLSDLDPVSNLLYSPKWMVVVVDRSHLQVGSLEVGSFHTPPIGPPLSLLFPMGVVREPYRNRPTYK